MNKIKQHKKNSKEQKYKSMTKATKLIENRNEGHEEDQLKSTTKATDNMKNINMKTWSRQQKTLIKKCNQAHKKH